MSASSETQLPISEHLEVVCCEDVKEEEKCSACMENPLVENKLNPNAKAGEGTPENPPLSVALSGNHIPTLILLFSCNSINL